MATGWVENTSKKGYKYYFDPSTGVMATGTKTIDGKKYTLAAMVSFRSTITQVLLQRQVHGLLRISLQMHYIRLDRLFTYGAEATTVGCHQKGHKSKMETVV